MENIGFILAALLLLFLNGFFVLAEFAAVKIRSSRVEELIEQGDPKAKVVDHILAHLDDYLSVCQVGITFASIGLGFVGEPAVARLIQPVLARFGLLSETAIHSVAVTVAYVFVSFMHILIGELVPKSIAIRATDAAALATARPLRVFHALFWIPLKILIGSANLLLGWMGLGAKVSGEHHSEEELRIILNRSQSVGLIPFRRLLLLENVFDLGELKVRDAMRPRALVKGLWAGASWADSFRLIRESRLSRLPLMKEGMDKPLGIIHIKDLLIAGPDAMPGLDLERMVRPYHTTYEDMPLENLLAELQKRRLHLAIVLDRTERWTGLITLEDIIEEIVGTVEDEFEVEPPIFIGDVLTTGRIVLGIEATSMEEAIRRAIARIPREELPFAGELVSRLVKDRALLAVSFLGEGLSVSHARAEGLDRAILIFARSDTGVPIKGVTEKAHLIFVLLTPLNQPRVQARLLARIGGLLDSGYVEQRLREATTAQEVLEAIRAGETAALG